MDVEIGMQRDIIESKAKSRRISSTSENDRAPDTNLKQVKSEPNIVVNEDSNSSDVVPAQTFDDDSSQSASQASADEGSETAAGQKKGRWAKEEDEQLLAQVEIVGDSKDKWVRIAEKIPNRVARQCRERFHYLKRHNECEGKRPWTDEENQTVMDMVQKHDQHSWKEIGKVINRPAETTKNHYHAVLKKLMDKENSDPQFIASRIATEPPAQASPAQIPTAAKKEPAARLLQSPLPKANRLAEKKNTVAASANVVIEAPTAKNDATTTFQSPPKLASSLPPSKAQTLDQVILEQKANSTSFASLFGSPRNINGKATTRFRLVGSTIQLADNKLRNRSVSTSQLDIQPHPIAEQPSHPVANITRGASPANAGRPASASKLKSKRKLFGDEDAVTQAPEVVKTVDESMDRSIIEESSSVQAGGDVNSSVSEMDLTLQHQSVDASLNQSIMMSPTNMSILDDSITSPSNTSKLNLSQSVFRSPTFSKRTEDLDSSISGIEINIINNTNVDIHNNNSSEARAMQIGLATSSEVPRIQPQSNNKTGSDKNNTNTGVDAHNDGHRTEASKLKARSKSLTELFSQQQLSTIMAAAPKPVITAPAVPLVRSSSAQVIPGFKISLKKKEDMKKPYSDLIVPPLSAPSAVTSSSTTSVSLFGASSPQPEVPAPTVDVPNASSETVAKPASAPATKGKRGRKRKNSLDSVKKRIDFENESDSTASATNDSEPPKKKLKQSPVPVVRSSRRTSRMTEASVPKFSLESVTEEKIAPLDPEQQDYIESNLEAQELADQLYTDISGIDIGDQSTANLFSHGEMLVQTEADEADMFASDLHLSCNEELDVNEIITTQGDAGAEDSDAVFVDLLVDENNNLLDDDAKLNSDNLFGSFTSLWF